MEGRFEDGRRTPGAKQIRKNKRVRSVREGVFDDGLRLLASNEAPVWLCLVCGEPASDLCIDCYEEPYPFYCRKHGQQHDCEEDSLRPVVNSPRMGVCGYG